MIFALFYTSDLDIFSRESDRFFDGNCVLDFYRALDSNNHTFSLCSKYLIENKYYVYRDWRHKTKHIAFDNYNKKVLSDLQDYIKFIESTDLKKYFNDSLKYYQIKKFDNVCITCVSKLEVDFLKQNFETVVVTKTATFDNSIEVDYSKNSLTDFFIQNTYRT